jgi:hypothetical protein
MGKVTINGIYLPQERYRAPGKHCGKEGTLCKTLKDPENLQTCACFHMEFLICLGQREQSKETAGSEDCNKARNIGWEPLYSIGGQRGHQKDNAYALAS